MKFKWMKRTALALVCMLGISGAAPAFAQSDDIPWPKTLTFAISVAGGNMQLMAQTLGKAIEENTPIQRVIIQPMGGSSVWLPRMEQGKVDLAIFNGPDIINAQHAQGTWTGQKPATWVRTLLPGHEIFMAVVATPASGITTISGLKGKIVFIKDPGTRMFEEIADLCLEAAGMTQADLKTALTRVNIGETQNDLIEGRADASFGTIAPAMLMEIQQAKGDVTVFGLTDEEKTRMRLPAGYFFMDVAANAPEWRNPHPIHNGVGFQTNLYCNANMDPRVTYGIVKAILGTRDKWVGTVAIASQWGKPARVGLPLMHEASIKYHKENGLWSDEVETWMESQRQSLGVEK